MVNTKRIHCTGNTDGMFPKSLFSCQAPGSRPRFRHGLALRAFTFLVKRASGDCHFGTTLTEL